MKNFIFAIILLVSSNLALAGERSEICKDQALDAVKGVYLAGYDTDFVGDLRFVVKVGVAKHAPHFPGYTAENFLITLRDPGGNAKYAVQALPEANCLIYNVTLVKLY